VEPVAACDENSACGREKRREDRAVGPHGHPQAPSARSISKVAYTAYSTTPGSTATRYTSGTRL
jgi:hypothetical protein